MSIRHKVIVIGGVLFLLFALVIMMLFVSMWTRGGAANVVVSRETTYLTQPLDENGQVDYAAAINQAASRNVTPETNAFVGLAEALGMESELSDWSHHQHQEFLDHLGDDPLARATRKWIEPSEFASAKGEVDLTSFPQRTLRKILMEVDGSLGYVGPDVWSVLEDSPAGANYSVELVPAESLAVDDTVEPETDDGEVAVDEEDEVDESTRPAESQANADKPLVIPLQDVYRRGDRQFEEMCSALNTVVYDVCQRVPWKREEYPIMAEWMDDSAASLDLVVEASKRPYYFSPLVRGGDEDGGLFATLLPFISPIRAGCRALSSRAMMRLGEADPQGAAEDWIATIRVGRHASHGFFLVDGLVGIACETIGYRSIAQGIRSGRLDRRSLEFLLKEIDQAPPRSRMFNLMANERYGYLDFCQVVARTGNLSLWDSTTPTPQIPAFILQFGVDWNVVMRAGNSWYDDLVKAGQAEAPWQRLINSAEIEQRLQVETQQLRSARSVAQALTMQGRSELFASGLVTMFLPAVTAVYKAEARVESELARMRAALALEIYQRDHGEYPETLQELVPTYLPAVPQDGHVNAAIRYRRTASGYVVYSVGENQVDDGGVIHPEGYYMGVGDEAFQQGDEPNRIDELGEVYSEEDSESVSW